MLDSLRRTPPALSPQRPRCRYVFLAASSSFKGKSDLLKYEKARKLKKNIGELPLLSLPPLRHRR